MKVSKAFAAAEAFVSAYQGAAAALKKGALGFPEAAAVIAKGIGFVAAIKGVNENGGGGGGSVGGGGSYSSGAAGGQGRGGGDVTNIALSLVGDSGYSRAQIVGIIEQINDAVGAGSTLNVTGA